MKHKKTPIFAAFGPEANIKRKIRRHLKKLGFKRGKNGALEPPSSSKESVRALHQCRHVLHNATPVQRQCGSERYSAAESTTDQNSVVCAAATRTKKRFARILSPKN